MPAVLPTLRYRCTHLNNIICARWWDFMRTRRSDRRRLRSLRLIEWCILLLLLLLLLLYHNILYSFWRTCKAWGQLQLLLRLVASLVSEQGNANEPGVYWADCTDMIVPVGHVSANDWVSQPTLWYVLSVPVNNAGGGEKQKKTKYSNLETLIFYLINYRRHNIIRGTWL